MNKPLVLIVDDEPQMRKLLAVALETNGIKSLASSTGKEALAFAANHHPDLLLLDVNLPDANGLELLKELRGWFTHPVIMLSVLHEEELIVEALNSGASDYISKPFRTAELIARINVALRTSNPKPVESEIAFHDLRIDFAGRTVKRGQDIIHLTATEFDLLHLLAKHAGRVLTHQFILKEIWGVGHQNDTPYLRVFINTLRKKIERDPNNPSFIVTESRVGYRFHASL